MEYRTLGRTGVMVSPICLGSMNFGKPTSEEDSVKIINHAIDSGINFIDTANVYNDGESERIVGKALVQNGHRNEIVLATKFWAKMGESPNDQGASRYHIIKACEDSLKRLHTDRIDLYQIHRPSFVIPQEETLRAFDDLIKAGKVRYIGCSTFPAWLVVEAISISEKYGLNRYISEQPPYNLLYRTMENELIPMCQRYGMAILPWSPTAMGVLAGRYPLDGSFPKDSRASVLGGRFKDRANIKGRQIAAKVAEMAVERNLTSAQLALLWVKDQPGVTSPIIGPRTMDHLTDAIPVMNMTLADEDRPIFDKLVNPGNAVVDFHSSNEWMKTRIVD